MAIDPNIAMGIRPIEQPNMLAQMGQMMQLRQAQQEYEGQNALRDAFASGGSLNDPAFVQRLRAANPKMAMDIEAKYLTGEKTRSELLGTAHKNSKEFLTLINSPDGLREYTISQFSDPIIGPALKARGITPETALANLDKEIATTGFNTVLKKSAMGLEKFFSEEMQTERSRISAAPGNRQASIAEQRFGIEQKQQAELDAIARNNAPTNAPMTTPMSGGGGGPLGSGTFGIPTGTPAGRPNALIQGSPSNMLLPGAQSPAPAATPAPSNDPYDRIAAIDREIAKYPINNPRSIPILQALNAQRTQLLASAKQEFGGDVIDMTVPNPAKPGTFITVKGRRDQRGVYQPVEMGEMPLSTNASNPNSSTGISPTVARPAPRAGYQYNADNQEVKIPQTGVPEGLRLKPGERWNEEKQSVEQVPGSAAFIEQQKKHAGDLNSVKTTQTSTNWGTSRIDKILDPKNRKGFENNFGGFTAYGTKEFSGNTALVKSEIDSLKSDLKNRGLQIIRSGGSIGAITEKEWPIIESMIATLSPKMDIKDAETLLGEVRAKFEALENLAAEKYNDQWRDTQYHKPVETRGGAGGNVPQAAIEMLKSNPNLSADFDAKYGPGASKRYTGK